MIEKTALELLLYCLGRKTEQIRGADPSVPSRFKAKLEQLSIADWQAIVELSLEHGVTPLLYYGLYYGLDYGLDYGLNHSSVNVPASIRLTLQKAYLANLWRNARLYRQLNEILLACKKADIPLIALKGAHLAEIVYDDRSLRPMADVDLLVRKSDLSQVKKTLLEMGYTLPENKDTYKHLTFVPANEGVPLEVHWQLQHSDTPFKLDVDKLWERAQLAMIADVEVLVLCPEDLLLHLCLHAAYDHLFYFGLRFFVDIFYTIRHYEEQIDWQQLELRARQWGSSKSLLLTLYLTKEFWQAAVPDEALDKLKADRFERSVLADAKQQIFADKSYSSSTYFAKLWQPKRPQDKVIYFLKCTFVSPQIMAEMYPAPADSWRIYLYYLVRLKDLLIRYRGVAWQSLRRDERMIAQVKLLKSKAALKEWLASP